MEHTSSKKRIAGLVVLIILIILATALVVVNPFKYLKQLQPTPVQETQKDKAAVSVNVESIALSDLQNTIKGNGNVIDPSSLDVYPEVAGTLTSLDVSVGDRVAKDQVLATVDPSRAGVVYKSSSVKAPASGTILSLPFVQGSTVSMQAPIARIGLLENLEVVMDIAERNIGSVGIGTKAEFRFKAFGDKVFTGQVSRLSPVLNPATRTLEIRLTIDDPDNLVKSGMFPSVTLLTEQISNVVVIARSSLLYNGDQAYVYVVDENNIAHTRSVSLGMEVDDLVQITEGLQVGDVLVIQGQSLLTEGTQVRVL
ncbi:MAG: efflux RND transporter periplasmic adaptor subunit [Sphaerochaeta sp.]|uniref:efflux RND transporter periplasmic adaptor subunit n=1 Tax=Sphaerochaeta sp. TaxID=1972642 RepID=UPI002FC6F4C6